MKKTWKKVLALVVCVLITVSVVAVPASAYELWSHKIKSSLTFIPYSGFSSTSRGHMRFCTNDWNATVGKNVVFMSSSTHNSSTGFSTVDGKNYVYKQYLNKDEIALTDQTKTESVPSNPAYKYLLECDIVINTKYSWANSAKPDCLDTYSVFLHEMGHAIGLWDVYDSTTPIMYKFFDTNREKRSLSQDDRNEAAFIYR